MHLSSIITTQQHAFTTFSLSNGGNTQNIVKCWLCSEGHKISDCDTLKNAPVELRIDIVKLNKLCFNCLSNSHFINTCKSINTYKIADCGKRHHTLLHKTETVDPLPEELSSDHSNIAEGTTNNHSAPFLKDFTYLKITPVILNNGNARQWLEYNINSPKNGSSVKIKDIFQENLESSSALCNSDGLMSSLVNFEISSVLNNKSRKISAYTVNQLNVPIVIIIITINLFRVDEYKNLQ